MRLVPSRIPSRPHRTRSSVDRPGAVGGWLALAIVLVSSSGALVASSPAGADITGDKQKVAQLQQAINAKAAVVEGLVSRYNAASSQLASIEAEIVSEQRQLAVAQRGEQAASRRLRTVAIDAYVNATSGTGSSFSSVTGPMSLPVRQLYLGVASGGLNTAIAALELQRHRATVAKQGLEEAKAKSTAALATLASSKSAAQLAVAAEQASLAKVNANLLALVNAANLRREQEKEAAAEAALAAEAQQAAAQQAAAQQAPQSAPVTLVSANATPGSYANPLRSVSGLSPERIDQGVDYGGFGPVYAVGDGVVISTYNGGWPAGTFISYRLTDGPAAGLVVYAAEDLNPTVSIGQRVTPNTVIGQMYQGYYGIETGWATDAGDGVTMAASEGQYWGGNSTAFGVNFSQFLSSLGAPGGQQSGDAGSLPAGWPAW